MAHLLAKVLELGCQQLEGLAKNRVEGLVDSLVRTLVLGDSESRDVEESLCGQLSELWGGRFDQEVLVLHHLADFLQHGDRLVEVDRYTEPGEVLADSVLDDLPHAHLLIGRLQSWKH